jgi:RND family efflux transporter MFP subunit
MPLSPENNDKRNLWRFAIGGVLILLLILGAGAYSRFSEASDLREWTRKVRIPTVTLIYPQGVGHGQPVMLPGTLQAYYSARIYSRVSGYLRVWHKDIGARVRKGDLLAVINTPELDQQIAQARADLGAATSAEKLSEITARRWLELQRQDAVASQDVDVKRADLATKTDARRAAQAGLDRLLAMKGFARIIAPFDGVVTQRSADIGALVGDSGGGDPLFTVADMHALRLYVNVPQSYSALIAPGTEVSLTVPEYPGRVFQAKLVSSSGAISTQSSALLVQFDADNRLGLLKPGGFAQVSLAIPHGASSLRLPVSALMFRATGLRVATLGFGSRVVMKPITIAADLGTEVVIASGLAPRDQVINNPPDSLEDGDLVRVADPAQD